MSTNTTVRTTTTTTTTHATTTTLTTMISYHCHHWEWSEALTTQMTIKTANVIGQATRVNKTVH
jgi:hypothetical protein